MFFILLTGTIDCGEGPLRGVNWGVAVIICVVAVVVDGSVTLDLPRWTWPVTSRSCDTPMIGGRGFPLDKAASRSESMEGLSESILWASAAMSRLNLISRWVISSIGATFMRGRIYISLGRGKSMVRRDYGLS